MFLQPSHLYLPNSQLISKCSKRGHQIKKVLYLKSQNKIIQLVPLFLWFDFFLAEILTKISLAFGRFEDTKRTIRNQLTFTYLLWRSFLFLQDSRIVIEKFKSGFSAPGDIPFEDLSSADNASVKTQFFYLFLHVSKSQTIFLFEF